MIGSLVYILCTLTSAACCLLLFRGYRRSRLRLLLWSALCFAVLTVANALLFLDLIVYPEVSLLRLRTVTTLAAVLILVGGQIFESQ
jgi:hypothetical protein